MSTSRYSPTESSYWSSPRLKIPIKAVNLDLNHNVAVSQATAPSKSLSEPSSPQLWHKVSNTDHVEVQRLPEKNQAAHSGSLKTRHKHMTRKYSDSTELAELLAEHQGRQLRSMQSINTGIQQPWGSSSRLNELHIQTNACDNGFTGYTGQMPLNNGTVIQASHTMPTGMSVPSTRSTISSGYSAPHGHITNALTSHRHSPLNLIGEGYTSSSSSPSRSISPSSEDSDKWSSYLRAKDELIGQKDQIIDRQKQSIFQLQQQLMLQTNSAIHQAVPTHYHVSRTQSTGDSSSLSLKLQESQYENAQLRALLSEKDSSLDKVQKKLGETEYLMKNMEASVKDSAASNRQELELQKQKAIKQEKAQAELTSKLEQLEEEKLKLKREKQSLERYLKEVPTVEEYQKLNKTLKDVRDEREKLRETISAKDKKLARMNKAFGNKDDEAKKLTVENTTLKENVQRLQVSLDKISNDGPVSLISFEDLKMENERLQVELDRTKKALENKHKKMKTLHCQTQKEQKSLEERLTQEEEMVHALRDELVAKENSLEEVRKAVKEIASHNQDLLEENLNLQCRCEQLQILNSKEKLESQRKLWKELSECTAELTAVVQVCRERREGKDPDMSVLLGLRSTSMDEDDSESKDTSDDVDAVKSKVNQVQRLRSDVEDLRRFISDQYAEDIGNNCRMQ
ncbi:centrosomal protein of 85 kDa-like [Pocillopora verrucosa]|uniref:centrosomal protein of 85 kDa-like n=1 Tax=Pocillopora verrucosa TaxID=203993 RepID=UPI0033419C0E